jgi:TRAP-type uncharacterized transport system fused permease subunit
MASDASQPQFDDKALEELEKKYDSALQTRETGPLVSRVLPWLMIAFAAYHVWTAGFGTPTDHIHMGIHLAGLFLFIFISFPFMRTDRAMRYDGPSPLKPGNVPLIDWAIMLFAMAAALFLWVSWTGVEALGIPPQFLRQGNPTTLDVSSARC